jgi:hypothetical protein
VFAPPNGSIEEVAVVLAVTAMVMFRDTMPALLTNELRTNAVSMVSVVSQFASRGAGGVGQLDHGSNVLCEQSCPGLGECPEFDVGGWSGRPQWWAASTQLRRSRAMQFVQSVVSRRGRRSIS